MTTSAQPGWYDDPESPTAQRYWDGQNWTPHRQRKNAAATQPEATSVAPPPPPPPPPGPTGGPSPWEQLGPQMKKARDDGRQLWSAQPRQRKVIFAAAGGLVVIVAAIAFFIVGPGVGGGSPQVDKSSPSYKMGLDSGTKGDAEMAAFGYFSLSEARNVAPVSHQEACEQAFKSDDNPFTRPEGGLNKTDYIAGCMYGLDHNPNASPAAPRTVVPPSKKGPNGATVPNTPGS